MSAQRQGGRSLHLQLLLAMTAAAAVAVVGLILGMVAAWELEDALLKAALTAQQRIAVQAVESGQSVDSATLMDVMAAFRRQEHRSVAFDAAALLGASLLGMGAAAALSQLVSSRLGAPIASVARAAAALASGDLGARAAATGREAGEIGSLQRNFNTLAQSLERSEAELRESAATLSHELRTPLTVLRLQLQALAEGLSPAGPAEFARLIRQTDMLSRIVDDLRTLTLAYNGRLTVSAETVDLSCEARTVLEDFELAFRESGVRLISDLNRAVAWADPLRLRQIIQVIVDNVCRHAAEGGEIVVRTSVDDGWASLHVLDRGRGLPAADRSRVFQPFWRSDLSPSSADKGTGLGLSLAMALARAQGATLTFDDRDGGGSAVVVRLPRLPSGP